MENNLLGLTAQITAAYLAHNRAPSDQIGQITSDVYGALKNAADGLVVDRLPAPAVPIGKSVMPDYIVCLEDGKKLKMLKRHLETAFGLTPEGYRKRWGLPNDYPMTAPNYAKHRSVLAKRIGLGTPKTRRHK